ncbi:MAG: hypothetical protein AAGD38_24775, partial [Acidobacteriota bacterium]
MKLFNRKTSGEAAADPAEHHSPGLATLVTHLEKREQSGLLDLGPSTTDSLHLLGPFAGSVEVVDLFRSVGGRQGERAERFVLPSVDRLPLPDSGAYDAMLLWDLPLYLPRGELVGLVEKIRPLCRPGAILFLVVTTVLPLAPNPLHFRIVSRDRLAYVPPEQGYDPTPRLMPRDFEKNLRGFRPLHYYQLRNGLKELLFIREAVE